MRLPRCGGVIQTLTPTYMLIRSRMIQEEGLFFSGLTLDMDISPSFILFIPVAGRLLLAISRHSFNVLFIDPRETFLFCMALGILTYHTIMNSSLISGILVGLGSRVLITYFLQGRRWTVLCGIALGLFSSDVVTLFWTYVNQENARWNAEWEKDQARRKKRAARRRISDPARPTPSIAAAADDKDLQNAGSDSDVLSLKRKLAQAEADIRRLQEERQWSMYVRQAVYDT